MAETTIRPVLPIDAALVWAFTELLKPRAARLRGPADYGQTAPGFTGSRVDVSRRIIDQTPDGPHPDALAIEAALRMIDLERLIITGYPIGAGLAADVDLGPALDVARRDLMVTIVRAARRGQAPDHGAPPEFEPVIGKNGQPAVWHKVRLPAGEAADGTTLFTEHAATTRMARKAEDNTGKFCKLKWTRDAGDVAEDRARYALWHAALVYLASTLKLASIRLTPPTAVPEPWIASSTPECPKGISDVTLVRRMPRSARKVA